MIRALLLLIVLLAGLWPGGASAQITAGSPATTQPVSGTVTVTDGSGALNVICDSGCVDNTSDTDDASVATGQSTGLSIGLTHAYDGSVWRRLTFGTAGTASAQVLTVQGVALMTPLLVDGSATTQPVSGTFWQATQPVSGTFWQATQPVSGTVTVTDGAGALNTIIDSGTVTTVSTVTSLSQFAGAAINLGSGTIGTGTLRVNLATDDPVNDAAVETSAAIGTTAAAVPASGIQIGGTDGTNLVVPYIDPCQREARTQYVVDIVTATTTEIANAVASEFFYLCSVSLFSAGTNNVAIVEDDTDTCGSPTAGLNGGVTAAEGYNFVAQTGIATGTGGFWVMKTSTANRYLCIITSGAVQLSGAITYVSAP